MNQICKSAYVAIVEDRRYIYFTCHISVTPICAASKCVECLSAVDKCMYVCVCFYVYVIKGSH